jgi:dTDP-4-amino-4,6-dideoxygalactose transaminase
MNEISFNLPIVADTERRYVSEALSSSKHSGDGPFTKACQAFFEKKFGFTRSLLTTSCTDALELAALLLDLKPGDEVILPSFTFVSSANAFALRGAKLLFADSGKDNPNITVEAIASLITDRTRVIVVVHYAGVACDMDPIMELAARKGIAVVEDAAQAIDSFYKGRRLGGIGTAGAFSFHDTKNISCGEGGLFITQDPDLAARAEIIREKGTNRSAFNRGEIDKYGWIDIGSSFLPSDILAAYLLGQLERLGAIQSRRVEIWKRYYDKLKIITDFGVSLPHIPEYATNNGHMFYLVCASSAQRSALMTHLKANSILPASHYLSLHSSPFFATQHDGRPLPHSDRYTDCLIRLPLHVGLSNDDVDRVCEAVVTSLSP